jgi:hypothetical protein
MGLGLLSTMDELAAMHVWILYFYNTKKEIRLPILEHHRGTVKTVSQGFNDGISTGPAKFSFNQ